MTDINDKSAEVVAAAAAHAEAVELARQEQIRQALKANEEKAKKLLLDASLEAKTLVGEAAYTAKQSLEKAASAAMEIIKDAKQNTTESLAVIANDISYLRRDVAEIKETLKTEYVTHAEFDAKFVPIQRFVYALIAILGVATMGAIAAIFSKVFNA